MANFYFTRYHILTAKDINDKVLFLLNGLRNDASVFYRKRKYKFFNSSIIEFENEEYIYGYLVKYNPEDEEEVVDEKTMELKDEKVLNKVIAKSLYIIYPKFSLLIFGEVPNALSKNTFIRIFKKLFEENHDNFFTEIDLTIIKQQYSFIEKIKTLKFIKKVQITLFPSNPNFSERWENIDKRLQRNNISKYKEIQENKKTGTSLIVDEETESKFLMSEDGYGESNASGIDKNGNEIRISTKDTNRAVKVNIDEKNEIIEILKILSKTLNDIVKRTL